jgi:tetratricopeptide (TPR) repeat protein
VIQAATGGNGDRVALRSWANPGWSVLATVRSDGWFPTDDRGRGDIAILATTEEWPAEVAFATLAEWSQADRSRWQTFGYPVGYKRFGQHASGRFVGRFGPDNEWVQLDAEAVVGYRIAAGYSGSPVWEVGRNAVVGIAVSEDAANPAARSGGMIPIEVVARYWAPLAPLVRRGTAARAQASGRSLSRLETSDIRIVDSMPLCAPDFQPRPVQMAAIKAAIGSRGWAVVTAVAGARGVGKTQLAAACCAEAIRAGWPVVVWVAAQSEASILAGLAELADRLRLTAGDLETTIRARAALNWLSAHPGPGMVVFDNAEDPDLIARWLPRTGGMTSLVTTVQRGFAALGPMVDIDVFTIDDSTDYLCRRTGLDDTAGARRVAEELGGLPVALAQAAAVIGPRSVRFPSFDAYLTELAAVNLDDLLVRQPGEPYPHGFAEAVALALQDLDGLPGGERARRILDVAALLSADGVPVEYLVDRPAGFVRRRSRLGSDPGKPGVQLIVDRSLANMTSGAEIAVHRLVGRVLREIRQRDGTLDRRIARTARTLAAAVPPPTDDPLANVGVWSRLAPQVRALRRAAPPDIARKTAIRIWALNNDLIRHLNQVQDSQAVEVGAEVLSDAERLLGPRHRDTLRARNQLIIANNNTVGGDDGTIALAETNLEYWRSVAGPSHPDTLAAAGNLATAYQLGDRLGDAVTVLKKLLLDMIAAHGRYHINVFYCRGNLALAYLEHGDAVAAVHLMEENLRNLDRVHLPNRVERMRFFGALGDVYQEDGRTADAIAIYEANLAELIAALPRGHSMIQRGRGRLAASYLSDGRIADALTLHDEIVDDLTSSALGPDHRHTLLARAERAEVYMDAGRVADAILLYEEVLLDQSRVLGPDDPSTKATRDHLDQSRRDRQDPDQ